MVDAPISPQVGRGGFRDRLGATTRNLGENPPLRHIDDRPDLTLGIHGRCARHSLTSKLN